MGKFSALVIIVAPTILGSLCAVLFFTDSFQKNFLKIPPPSGSRSVYQEKDSVGVAGIATATAFAALKNYQQLLNKPVSPGADSDPNTLSPADQQQLLEARKLIGTQQDKLVFELVSAKKNIQSLTTDKERQAQTLASLQNEITALNKKLRDTTKQTDDRKTAPIASSGSDEKGGDRLVIQLRKIEAENARLNRELEQKKSVEADNANIRLELDRLQKENAKFTARATWLSECETQLASAKQDSSRLPELEQQIVRLNNDLSLMETEVALVRGKRRIPRNHLTQSDNLDSEEPEGRSFRSDIPPITRATQQFAAAKQSAISDVDTAVVNADKVNVRSGPGMETATIMQASKGMAFVVERREGDWYRVVTPVDTRGYLRADTVDIIRAGSTKVEAPISPTTPTSGLTPKKSVIEIAREAHRELNSGAPPKQPESPQDIAEFDNAFKALKEQIGKK